MVRAAEILPACLINTFSTNTMVALQSVRIPEQCVASTTSKCLLLRFWGIHRRTEQTPLYVGFLETMIHRHYLFVYAYCTTSTKERRQFFLSQSLGLSTRPTINNLDHKRKISEQSFFFKFFYYSLVGTFPCMGFMLFLSHVRWRWVKSMQTCATDDVFISMSNT